MFKKPLPFVLVYVVLCVFYFIVWENVEIAIVEKFFVAFPLMLLLVGNIRLIVHTGDKSLLTLTLALVFSIAGDVSCSFCSLMVFFAVVQAFYIITFSRNFSIRSGKQIAVLAVWLVLGIVICWLILHNMVSKGAETTMIAGGSVYMALLLGMSFTAISQFRTGWVLFAVGSLLFLISDSAIAVDRFVVPLPLRKYIVMCTYFAAQLLLNIKTSTDLIDK